MRISTSKAIGSQLEKGCLCTGLSWWRRSWTKRRGSGFISSSKFLLSSMVMNWLTGQEPRYKQLKSTFLRRVVRCLKMESGAFFLGVAFVKLILVYIERSQWFIRGPQGRHRICWRDYFSQLGTPRDPHWKSWRKCPGRRKTGHSKLRLLSLQPSPKKSSRGWMDGWMHFKQFSCLHKHHNSPLGGAEHNVQLVILCTCLHSTSI